MVIPLELFRLVFTRSCRHLIHVVRTHPALIYRRRPVPSAGNRVHQELKVSGGAPSILVACIWSWCPVTNATIAFAIFPPPIDEGSMGFA